MPLDIHRAIDRDCAFIADRGWKYAPRNFDLGWVSLDGYIGDKGCRSSHNPNFGQLTGCVCDAACYPAITAWRIRVLNQPPGPVCAFAQDGHVAPNLQPADHSIFCTRAKSAI